MGRNSTPGGSGSHLRTIWRAVLESKLPAASLSHTCRAHWPGDGTETAPSLAMSFAVVCWAARQLFAARVTALNWHIRHTAAATGAALSYAGFRHRMLK